MSGVDEFKKKAHHAIKSQQMRQRISMIAQEEGISFNQAMQRFFSQK